MTGGQRVAVVTGGGGGIGAAIAEELGRTGWYVVTLDPLVSLDGSERLGPAEVTTAQRIVAAGGAARASAVSVTDRDGVRETFEALAGQLGRLDAVVNVAGISRPTSFAAGTEEDWRAVLAVHLDGYRNVLDAALPIMARAGRGRILGVTSGSGWRAADAGAYSCAKRAVASLTWQLGRHAPPGVTINAISPIAVTRMVTAALSRASGNGSSTGGLSLDSMPTPEQLAPLAAHLLGSDTDWCNGQVIFTGGPEAALVDPPRLLEVVRTDDVTSLPQVLEVVTGAALGPAEANQASGGGSSPRFAGVFREAATLPAHTTRSCAVVSDRPDLLATIQAALEAQGIGCPSVPVPDPATGCAGAAAALAATVERAGPVDSVIVALAGPGARDADSGWGRLLVEHEGIVEQILTDAAWARAVSDHAVQTDRPVRLVTLTDATTAGGRSRAQAAAQAARMGRATTKERVSAFAVSVEASSPEVTQQVGVLAAHLAASAGAAALAGAELVAGAGWCGVRSHPRPGGSISFGGPDVPSWFDATLREIAAGP